MSTRTFLLPPLLPVALALVALLSGCSSSKQIAAHGERLRAAAAPGVSLVDKRDALGESAVAMMHQAVDRLNPKKGARFVTAYAKTNGPYLDTLVAQIRRGQAAMTNAERIAFGLGAVSRPYAKDALELMPRFVKKYRQVQAVSRITGGLKEAILGKAAERLGGLLGAADAAVDPRATARQAGRIPALDPSAIEAALDPHRQREAETHAR